jgi:hypothetical protein
VNHTLSQKSLVIDLVYKHLLLARKIAWHIAYPSSLLFRKPSTWKTFQWSSNFKFKTPFDALPFWVQVLGVRLPLESESDEAVVRSSFEDPCGKLRFAPLGRRLFYNDFFAYAGAHLAGALCAQAHSDIAFEAGLDLLNVERHLAGGQRVLALSRHEAVESDVCGRNMCYRCRRLTLFYCST